jgi:transposase
MRKMARYPKGANPKLTNELIEAIVESIRQGAYVETAVALAGVSKQSFYRWLREAESDEAIGLIRKLSDAVKKAMAEAEMRDLAVIDRAAQSGEWTAAAWRLDRRHPERWGRQARVQVEHSGSEEKPVNVQAFKHLSEQEQNDRIEKLHKRLGRFLASRQLPLRIRLRLQLYRCDFLGLDLPSHVSHFVMQFPENGTDPIESPLSLKQVDLRRL